MSLSQLPLPPTVRVADTEGRLAFRSLVWDANQMMLTIGFERRRSPGSRGACKADVEVVRAAGHSLTQKEVLKALKAAGKKHGPGTVAKSLADLTVAGTLVNLKDKRGYLFPEWKRRQNQPSLF